MVFDPSYVNLIELRLFGYVEFIYFLERFVPNSNYSFIIYEGLRMSWTQSYCHGSWRILVFAGGCGLEGRRRLEVMFLVVSLRSVFLFIVFVCSMHFGEDLPGRIRKFFCKMENAVTSGGVGNILNGDLRLDDGLEEG